jgi:short subunit dehydrogenase-like uncharacterized protein
LAAATEVATHADQEDLRPMSQQPRSLIYGANGYTGRLIARRAVELGVQPTLAGRNHEAVAALAAELACPGVSFTLEQPAQIAEHLRGFSAVLNCAGPFSRTARPLIDACLMAGTHYLDITGEIEVIELAASRGQRAKQAGVALLPAVGFDVVPSDCLAAMLAERLPAARVLQLAFTAIGGLSPGTAKTMVEALPRGGLARIDGQLRSVPIAWKTMEVPFSHRKMWAMTIPWGDVASAYYSTGIPNIEVYTTAPPKQIAQLRRLRFLLPIMAFPPLQHLAKRWIDRKIKGPPDEVRETGRSWLWGRVSDDQGKSVSATLETLSGYKLTALTAVSALEKTLAGQAPHGFATPSQAFGREFILSFPDTRIDWQQA